MATPLTPAAKIIKNFRDVLEENKSLISFFKYPKQTRNSRENSELKFFLLYRKPGTELPTLKYMFAVY